MATNPSYNSATGNPIASKNGLPMIGCSCPPTNYVMEIIYDWDGNPSYDLDTGTEVFGTTVGWSCGSGNAYISWSGDNTAGGAEYVSIAVSKARRDGLWMTSTGVRFGAHWYAPAQGSGAYTLRVTYRGVTKTRVFSPPQGLGCAANDYGGLIVIHDDLLPYPDGSFFDIIA